MRRLVRSPCALVAPCSSLAARAGDLDQVKRGFAQAIYRDAATALTRAQTVALRQTRG